ncbi:MAG: hypothetical protein GC168_06080 [Candidatus Hydrogenedens sp.]|nr:hypothetical protein [Candidatus Hydrogenedens sp.]
MKKLSHALVVLGLLCAGSALAQDAPAADDAASADDAAPKVVTYEPWDQETLDLFATLPVQDGGRVKPLDTYARFALLKINGKWSLDLGEEGKIKEPVAWLLYSLFYPEIAADYHQFIVDNYEAVAAIGIDPGDKKRARYSYNEIAKGAQKLFELDNAYRQKEQADRTTVEQQIINLAENFLQYDQILHYFDFARRTYTAPADSAMGAALTDRGGASLSMLLMRAPEVLKALREEGTSLTPERVNQEAKAIAGVMDELEFVLNPTHGMALIPPPEPSQQAWMTPADMATRAFNVRDLDAASNNPIEMLGLLERLPGLVNDRDAFKKMAAQFHSKVTAAASLRGEYDKVPLEVSFYRMKWIPNSQVLYLISFFIVALSWVFPYNRWWRYATQASVLVPTILLIVGITIRCIIRERPPVSTLYETVLFITACSVATALIIEWMNKERIVIALAAVLGTAGMFLANRYEMKEGVDTMPALIAVLDTNFWLSTHVTTVTFGYAAGMLAGAIAHIYIIGRVLRIRIADRKFYQNVTKMTYGVLCFGLLFSVVGTILGGIWANDSWGRFWGWDPKENGALMICLWSLCVLHAKMGGYIKELGINMGAVIMAIIVTFSWWGVNNLGVGLHSYGFVKGVWFNLFLFWGFEGIVLLAGFALWLMGDTLLPKRAAANPESGHHGKTKKPQTA